MTVPDWLTLRSGTLKPGINAETLFVMVGGQLLYRLAVRPASGKYSCAITSTVNGKRLDDGITYAAPHDALAGGLEQLRAKLGW